MAQLLMCSVEISILIAVSEPRQHCQMCIFIILNAGVENIDVVTVPLFTFIRFRSTPKSRPNNLYMGLRCPSARMSVCPQKVFPIPMKFGM